MGVFDIGTAATGMQNAASMVAGSLAPKKTTAQSLIGPGAPATLHANASATAAATNAANASSGTITSNDFLTLLVTELKNQDPTQPTDPNAYITQLVGVNSLQQLISINQGIGTLDTATPGTSAATATTPVTGS